MTDASTDLRCTFTGCTAQLVESAAWLPAVDAMRRANGGKRVEVTDFPRFVLCARHGNALRNAGIKVFRYAATIAHLRVREEQRGADASAVKAFAERFAKKEGQPGAQPRRRGDGRNVDGGLSRCSRIDDEKLRRKLKSDAAEQWEIGTSVEDLTAKEK